MNSTAICIQGINLAKRLTGVPYDAYVPCNLTGIRISALMLTRYNLKWRSYGYYKEFLIPSGVIEEPYARKLVLVYQNLANWSSLYYPLPGYTYLTPVLGILSYDAYDLYAKNVPELDILALEDPITIKFHNVQPAPQGSLPKCVYFYSNNLVEFRHVIDGNICLTRILGHFAIVTEVKIAPSRPPTPDEIAPSPSPTAHHDNNHQKMWTFSLLFIVFCLSGILFVIVKKYRLWETRRSFGDSAAIIEPLLGNIEAPLPLEAQTRPLS
ncbi:uncharacterized protein LOC107830428 [Nicotiana tabacum]|uniref:Uncharacterized protein LOC107830428 n=1 Tax=Nicotiana tabacum TaxID=4097 RepID=A0A1S4DJ85_TOBAC|nr:PREDICTED: uncharacterized protein LOC107830428 [Nicotiana tabacum]